jgi:hypothetical protein
MPSINGCDRWNTDLSPDHGPNAAAATKGQNKIALQRTYARRTNLDLAHLLLSKNKCCAANIVKLHNVAALLRQVVL